MRRCLDRPRKEWREACMGLDHIPLQEFSFSQLIMARGDCSFLFKFNKVLTKRVGSLKTQYNHSIVLDVTDY